MTRTFHRLRNVLGCLAIVSAALVATACAAPQFTYIADSSDNTFFKVPGGWHRVADKKLASQLRSGSSGPQPGVWEVGYDAAAPPSAAHVFSPDASQPFAFALVFPLSLAASNAMSYNGLRDVLLPVTPTTRQSAASRGFPLTGFHLLRDTMLTPGHGVHGVRVTFTYTYPGGVADTFDQVALTNSNDTHVYVLLVHCLSTCYRQHQKEINTVMTSFTVRARD